MADEFAFWRRLDATGHDAALLTQSQAGWSLQGAAVFAHRNGPACVNYSVDLDASWRTRCGAVQGFLGDRKFDHSFSREPDGWRIAGILIDGLSHLWDLDYGFTPATNLLQLRRAALAIGQTIDLPVAWFDIESAKLTELPQRYTRRDEASFWYEAPTFGYKGLLELAPNGFIANYPGLWRLEM